LLASPHRDQAEDSLLLVVVVVIVVVEVVMVMEVMIDLEMIDSEVDLQEEVVIEDLHLAEEADRQFDDDLAPALVLALLLALVPLLLARVTAVVHLPEGTTHVNVVPLVLALEVLALRREEVQADLDLL